MVWLEEDEVCEEDEEVDELEEMGAEEPHSSLQRGQVCRSESGNEAICSFMGTQANFITYEAIMLRYSFGDTSARFVA